MNHVFITVLMDNLISSFCICLPKNNFFRLIIKIWNYFAPIEKLKNWAILWLNGSSIINNHRMHCGNHSFKNDQREKKENTFHADLIEVRDCIDSVYCIDIRLCDASKELLIIILMHHWLCYINTFWCINVSIKIFFWCCFV